MEDGWCSVCSKKGALRCGKCRAQYYCSKECQVKDWKVHKKVCSDVRENRIYNEAFSRKSDDLDETIQELKAMSVIPLSNHIHTIPKYHFEYRDKYPKDVGWYRKLRNMWITFTTQTEARIKEDLDEYVADEAALDRRWGVASGFKELRMFLARNPKFGDIFADKPVLPYGNFFNKKIYDTMKNCPTPPQTFELGETYVAVGFVDMFPLLNAKFIPNTKDPSKKPMHYFGYDREEIVVAKNMILFYMMAANMPLDAILQVWYSSGWSEVTLSNFQMICRVLLANDVIIPLKASSKTPMGRIRRLIQHWNDTTLSMNSVQILWSQHRHSGMMHALLNLRHKIDRVEYARYLSTGHLFGKDEDDYKYGNVTMFSLPDGYENMKRMGENFFNTIAVDSLKYETSITASVTKMLKAGLRTVIDLIKSGSLLCFFISMCICPGEEPSRFTEIQNMNPKQIDWTNVPDYTPLDGFFEVARQCSGPDTEHLMHFTNWIYYVHGAALLDYGDEKFEMYKKLIPLRRKEYECVKALRPFLRQDEYIEWHLNAAEAALALKYRKNYIDFLFKGRDVDVSPPIHERFNPFQRSEFIFFISFKFRK